MLCVSEIKRMRRRQNTAVALMTRAYVKLFALIYIATTVVVLILILVLTGGTGVGIRLLILVIRLS